MACKIFISEKGPNFNRHELDYGGNEKLARQAYKKMIAFWELNGHDALMVESPNKTVSVSADVVASATLIIGEKKVAKKTVSKK